ncbi:MAG: response regulator [Cyanobacteriota bacterium]|nr:response regulator [Cyanobacteriota bacterium]
MPSEPKVNVLLVDDHPENLLALEAILDGLGQHLVKAYSGEEALRCLLHQDFAVILLDVQMPGMDGFETATLIRNRVRSQHTPIIFLTAFSTSESLMFKGYSLGAVDYLFKPVEPDVLTSKVSVFVDLFKKTAEVKRQAAQLAAVNTELRESEQRFRSLSACSPVGIFLTDVEGRCTYTNPRFQAICGFTFEQSLGDGWLQSVHLDDRDRIIADWGTWTLTKCDYSHEFRLQTPEGIIRWVHLRSSPMLSAQGEFLGHVGTVEDITERKQAEEARAQVIREQVARQQAEAANRMKDEFLATLSHELRTPLNSILGWAGLLRTRSFDAATTARALETIERNAKSQAQLIEDILDVSRIIRGKLHLNLRPLNLVAAIETAIEAMRPAAEEKSIQLEVVLDAWLDGVADDGSPFAAGDSGRNSSANASSKKSILIKGDFDRLQQVVWNLVSNAIKFTPQGGKVEVRLTTTASHAEIQVIDTGIGISSEFLPYVFDRFRQEDSTTTRSYGGLGLGLAIVRHLVELHGGSVHVDSEGEGKGATFTVKLLLLETAKERHTCNPSEENPLEQPELKQESESSSPNPASVASRTLSGLQVLIVDDEPDVRDLLTVAIQESGAEAIAVESASEALKVLDNSQPDVLVSDIGMPLEDGYTLIRQVREREAKRGGLLPAVALTAYVREEDSDNAIASGFQKHMSKPVDTTQLVRVVASLVGRIGDEGAQTA